MALKFFQHHFAKLCHRDLLVTTQQINFEPASNYAQAERSAARVSWLASSPQSNHHRTANPVNSSRLLETRPPTSVNVFLALPFGQAAAQVD